MIDDIIKFLRKVNPYTVLFNAIIKCVI